MNLNNRLDGKLKKSGEPDSPAKPTAVYQRGIPDYDYQIGTLRFLRNLPPKKTGDKGGGSDDGSEFQAFSGSGQSLRQTKQRK